MGKRPHLHYIIFMWRLLLITPTKLAGNGIGKFRLSAGNSNNRISHILKTRLDLMPKRNVKQLSQESNILGGLSFSPLKFF